MLKSGRNIDERNKQILAALKKEVDKQPEKAKPYFDAANQTENKVLAFVKYIESIKIKLEGETGGRFPKGTQSEGQLKGRGNMEMPAYYMINEGHGAEVKNKINALNTDLSAIIKKVPHPIDSKKLLSLLELVAKDHPENAPHTWQSELFEHTPLAAVITLLTKMQNDAKNAGSECIAELAKSINADDFEFDQLVAIVVPKSTTVVEGEKFEADIFLSHINSQHNYTVTVNGSPITVENGIGKFEQGASIGEYKYRGAIEIKKPDETIEYKEFNGTYTGIKASATISADKMNVLYIGLANPVTIGIAGARSEDVECTFEGAVAKLIAPGHYIVDVGSGVKEVKATATAKGKAMGSMTFRIKSVPKPFPLFGTKESGRITPAEIDLQSIIWVGLGPEFLFDGMKYTATKYTLTYKPYMKSPKEFTVTGSSITQEIKDAIKDAKSGDQITVKDIVAIGPGRVGLVRSPSAIALTVK